MPLRRHRVAVFGTRQELAAALGTYADRRPPVVEEADLHGGRVDGRRTRWAALRPGERLRRVGPQGGSLLLALSCDGRPFADWAR